VTLCQKPKCAEKRHKQQPYCQPHMRAYSREYYQRNKEKRRTQDMERKYGVSREDYDKMLADQLGRCGICDVLAEDAERARLFVDHEHSTGKVRGLLCLRCNLALGLLDDNPDSLRRAAEWL
jgi:hypothetical protein